MKLRVFRVSQRGGRGERTEVYVGVMPARELAERASVDRWSPEDRRGYQRPLNQARIRDSPGGIVRYLIREAGCFPAGIIVNVRGGVTFTPSEDQMARSEGVLDVGEERLWVIDGQHRLEGLRRAMQRNADFEEYPVVVSILNKVDRFDELMLFYVVNRRQSGVETELAYRHLQRTLWERGGSWLRDMEGSRGYRLARALDVVDHLDRAGGSPLAGRIRIVGDPESPEHLVTDKVLANAVAEAMKKSGLESDPTADFAEGYAKFWAAMSRVYPEAFTEPEGWLIWRATPLRALTRLYVELSRVDRGFTLLSRLREETPAAGEHSAPLDEAFWRSDSAPPWLREGRKEAEARLFEVALAKTLS